MVRCHAPDPGLRAEYDELLDDFVGYREALVRDDLDRWLANLEAVRMRLEEVQLAQGKPVPNVLIAPWPIETLGARTHAATNGDLILTNTGNSVAADAMARICVIVFDGYSDDAADRVVSVARAILCRKLTPQTAYEIPYKPEKAGGIRLLGGFAAMSPLCHEYAHALLGHTTHGVNRGLLDIRRTWPTEGSVLWSQRQELEADNVALDLALQAVPASDLEDVRLGGQRYAVLGTLLMLSLHALVLEYHWNQGHFEIGDGHPPPFVRTYGVMRTAEERELKDAVDAGTAFLGWFEAYALPAMRAAIEEGIVG